MSEETLRDRRQWVLDALLDAYKEAFDYVLDRQDSMGEFEIWQDVDAAIDDISNELDVAIGIIRDSLMD